MAAGEKAKIIIRADGNARIGAGHLMRCLTIADEIRQKDSICFWCADRESADLAESRGYNTRVLETDYRNMLSELPLWEDWMSPEKPGGRESIVSRAEKRARRSQTSGESERTILVDSYAVNEEYLKAIGTYGRVCLLDDMQQRAWPVDVVINYNVFAQKDIYRNLYEKQGRPADMPGLYLGPSYVPLRPQFREREYQVREELQELLITTGGGDQQNIAGQILEKIDNGEYRIHVVSGPYNPHGDWLDEYAAKHPEVVVHRQVTEMAELMGQCDLAITAGGTTVYELCAIGVPFICFSYAENQKALTAYAGKQGIGWDAGKYHHDPAETLNRIAELTRQAQKELSMRQRMSLRARDLVDGQGARRLAQVLEHAGEEENHSSEYGNPRITNRTDNSRNGQA